MAKDFSSILLSIIEKSGRESWEKDVIKEIGYEIFNKHFSNRKSYADFFEEIEKNPIVFEKYDHIIRFYYFWCIRPNVYNSLKPDFKLIIVFSIVEYLMLDKEYVSLGDWLTKQAKNDAFIITNKDELNNLLKKYYDEYGSQSKIKLFLSKYCNGDLESFLKGLKKWHNIEETYKNVADIDEIISFVIAIRNLFIHNATNIQISSIDKFKKDSEGYTHFRSETLTVIKNKSYAIDNSIFHIEHVLATFEKGLIEFFKKQ